MDDEMSEHQSDSGSLRVTLKDVHSLVGEVGNSVSEVKGSIAGLAAETRENTKDISDHEHRIRGLEAWRYALPGSVILGALGVLGSILVAVMQ